MGGLSKKAYQLDTLRAKESLPYLTIDAGSLLFKKERLAPGLQEQAKVTAQGIVEAYNMMGFDAVGVARQDLAAGLVFLKKLQDQSKFAWLSANLVDRSTKEPIFTPYIRRQVGELTVAIIGLTGFTASLPSLQDEGADIVPWQEMLQSLVADLSQNNDLIILLSNHTYKQNKEIAETIHGIHIIIQAGVTTANIAPKLVANTLICQTGKQGKYLGLLQINWKKSHTWGTDKKAELLQRKNKELSGINNRMNRYRNRLQQEQLKTSQGYQNLVKTKERIANEIKMLEASIEQQKIRGNVFSTFTNRFFAMDISLPDDPKVLQLVEETKQKINAIGRKKAAPKLSAPQLTQSPINYNSASFPLVGWRTCAACHDPQTVFWKKTRHANAYQTLAAKKQNFNLDCLPCHVTHDRTRPVNEILSLPETLLQVGCEACHGPGKKHAANPATENTIRKPSEAICLQCHTPDHDDNFNYEEDIKKIACPKI